MNLVEYMTFLPVIKGMYDYYKIHQNIKIVNGVKM